MLSLGTSLAASVSSLTGEEDDEDSPTTTLECTYYEGSWRLATNSTTGDHRQIAHYCRLVKDDNNVSVDYELPSSSSFANGDWDEFESGMTRLKLINWHPNDETGQLESSNSQIPSSFQVVVDEPSVPQYYNNDNNDNGIVAHAQINTAAAAAAARVATTARTSGSRNILVVRVSSLDAGSPSFSRNELSVNMFGDPQNNLYRPSLQLQYDQCSQGQLKFHPATFNGDDTTGVFDLLLDHPLANREFDFQVEQWLWQAFQTKFGAATEVYDHILFCLPRGMAGEFIAFAVLNDNRSFYSDPWCGMMSATMHEIGHNLGMRHSGEAGAREYDDESCIMGLGYADQVGPLKCFNGQKFWAFDWFPHQKTDVFLNTVGENEWKGNLAAFVDVSSTTMPIVLRVGDLYLAYNEATTYNAGVNEKKNQVTIVQGTTPTSNSVMLAGLNAGDTLQTRAIFSGNSDGSSTTSLVSIEVCAMQKRNNAVSFASLSIRLTGTPSSCGISETAPGPAPTTAVGTTSSSCSPGGTVSCDPNNDQCCGMCVMGTLGTVCKGSGGSGSGVAMAQQGGAMGGAGGKQMRRRLLRNGEQQGRKRGVSTTTSSRRLLS